MWAGCVPSTVRQRRYDSRRSRTLVIVENSSTRWPVLKSLMSSGSRNSILPQSLTMRWSGGTNCFSVVNGSGGYVSIG